MDLAATIRQSMTTVRRRSRALLLNTHLTRRFVYADDQVSDTASVVRTT